jgi:hypothetical protein
MRHGVFKTVATALALIAGLTTHVFATTFTDAQKQELAAAVAAFDTAMKASDFETVIDASIPPRLLNSMATTYSMTAEDLRTFVIDQMKQAMQSVKVESFGMDVAGAQYAEASDGSPYALLPSETVMDLNGSRTRSSGTTLALIDEGRWYLLNVGHADQVAMLKTVYTQFADVTFPEAKMEAVQ